MSPAGIEPSIPGSKRHQTHASNRAATAIGHRILLEKTNQGWNTLHVEGVEKLQQLNERRHWEDQETDEKD